MVISYDSDGAGQSATLRGLDILTKLGCDVRILQMDGAKDPDEYVTKYGKDRFNLLVQKAISLVEFKAKMLKQNLDLQNVNDKIKFLKQIAKLLSSVDSKIEQELYLNKIATDYNISKEAIYAEINKLSVKNQTIKILDKPKAIHHDNQEITTISVAEEKRENLVLALLIKNQLETYKKVKDKILVEDFKSKTNQIILAKLFETFENGKNIVNVLDLFEDENINNKISEILVGDYDLQDEAKGLQNIIDVYEKERLINMKREIIEEIATGDKSKIEELEKKLQEVIEKLTSKK